jgi:hypothetical protein
MGRAELYVFLGHKETHQSMRGVCIGRTMLWQELSDLSTKCSWGSPPEKAGACEPRVLGCPKPLKGACTGVPNGALLPPPKLPNAGAGVGGAEAASNDKPLPNGDWAPAPEETVGDPRPKPPKPALERSFQMASICKMRWKTALHTS